MDLTLSARSGVQMLTRRGSYGINLGLRDRHKYLWAVRDCIQGFETVKSALNVRTAAEGVGKWLAVGIPVKDMG
jgi:hypothetical protein